MQLKSRYDYHDTTDGVSQDEFLVLLGDFNARVGLDEGCWRGVVGRHRMDERNEAGEEILQLCAMNQLL